jgi:ATP-dependent helicase HrpB
VIRDAARELPVRSALPLLEAALAGHGAAVLCAPPGTGKTTLVPLALAGLTDDGGGAAAGAGSGAGSGSGSGSGSGGKVIVAEPRRIAARAAARRMAWLLGEDVGGTVGYTVRGDRAVSSRTRVEVVTTGVLLQRLQRDQELAGVDTVVLDECHERHLDADTAAAFLLDVRENLRPELRLVAASATTDTEGWATLLGGAPVVEAHGTAHPVDAVWAPPPGTVRPPHGTRVDPALLSHVASVVRRALAERDGDVLCFLPGVGEIARVAGALEDLPGRGVDVLQVHGRAPAAVQDAVLSPAGRRRVVLATSVAESSLTVPGVRVVVDSGLAREPRVDHARGLGALATVRASRAAGRQRAGRAGREAPGTVYRCWSEAEDVRLSAFPAPEIQVADLTAFALQAACWGAPEASGLSLLDPPPAGAMAAARSVLTAVGAIGDDGRATARGVRLARLGLHPRLGRALLDAAPLVGADAAAEVVALLSEEVPRSYGDDLAGAWRSARRGGDAYAARWRTEARRLRSLAGERATGTRPPADAGAEVSAGTGGGAPAGTGAGTGEREASSTSAGRGVRAGSGAGDGDPARPKEVVDGKSVRPRGEDAVAGVVAALAFPERVGRVEGTSCLMTGGTRARLPEGSPLRDGDWLAVAVADRPLGKGHARIRLAAVVDEETARRAAAPLYARGEEVRWTEGDVVAREVERLGAVELVVRPLRDAAPERIRAALLDGLRADGLGLLRWTQDARLLRQRLAFLHAHLGAPWPDVSDEALTARADEWLEPELGRSRRRADLGRIDAGQGLSRLLPWASGEAARLEELAPERLEVPSGSRVRVDYGDPRQPVLAVKLQEMFGLAESPTVAGVPVLVHLLSPAGRPAAVTADLASFWREGYRAVRAELRGRYPKHPWPEDPFSATPTRHTNARLRR